MVSGFGDAKKPFFLLYVRARSVSALYRANELSAASDRAFVCVLHSCHGETRLVGRLAEYG